MYIFMISRSRVHRHLRIKMWLVLGNFFSQLTGSVMGRVMVINWPFIFHSGLSGRLGTWTRNVTGPWEEGGREEEQEGRREREGREEGRRGREGGEERRGTNSLTREDKENEGKWMDIRRKRKGSMMCEQKDTENLRRGSIEREGVSCSISA